MTKLPLTFNGKLVITLETAQKGTAWSWAAFNASAERVATGDGEPDEAAALRAAKTFARQLFFELADELRAVPS